VGVAWFSQLPEHYRGGVLVDLGGRQVFIYAHWFGGGGNHVSLMWGAEPTSCVSLRQVHAEQLADALRLLSREPAARIAFVGDRDEWGTAATVRLQRDQDGGDVTLAAVADRSRISSAEGIALDIPPGALTRVADAIAESLRRLDEDE
jgi:hypothetical protein